MNRQNVQIFECAYPTIARDAVIAPSAANKQLLIHSISAYNANATSCDVGLGVRYDNAAWKLWTVQAANADATATIQAGSAVSILPTTNNYGFIAQCKDKFGLLSFTVSQAQTGSPTYSYQYWDGSTWATLTLRNSPVYTSTGSIGIAFAPPLDWAAGSGSAVDDFTSTNAGYCIRVRGTTAPSQAVQVTAMHVSRLWTYRNLNPKASIGLSLEMRPVLLDYNEKVQVFFATATANNSVEVAYQING